MKLNELIKRLEDEQKRSGLGFIQYKVLFAIIEELNKEKK